MKARHSGALLLAWVLASPASVVLAQGAAPPKPRIVAWNFYEENDVFAGTDQYYTQGLKFSFLREQEGSPGWAERLVPKLWNRLANEQIPVVFNVGWSLGQNIYTPDDIKQKALNRDDRPWAGWLYVGRLLQLASDCDPKVPPVPGGPKCVEQQHTFELDLGMVGPLSAARWTQTQFHRLIDSPKPQGWGNQIGNEPGVLLTYRGKWRFANRSSTLDFIPHAGGAVGNVLTYADLGGTVRAGKLTGFGTDTIPSVARTQKPLWDAYLFAGADGRAVAVNIFLDGNHFQDSYSVDKKHFVYDLTTGASARYKQWRLTYTLVRRSDEFEPRSGRSLQNQNFGSVVLSWERFGS